MTKHVTLKSKRTWVNKHMHVDNSKLIHCKYVNYIINIRKTIFSNISLVKCNFKNEISTCIFIWTFSFYFLFHSLLIFGNYCARYDSSIPCQVNELCNLLHQLHVIVYPKKWVLSYHTPLPVPLPFSRTAAGEACSQRTSFHTDTVNWVDFLWDKKSRDKQ